MTSETIRTAQVGVCRENDHEHCFREIRMHCIWASKQWVRRRLSSANSIVCIKYVLVLCVRDIYIFCTAQQPRYIRFTFHRWFQKNFVLPLFPFPRRLSRIVSTVNRLYSDIPTNAWNRAYILCAFYPMHAEALDSCARFIIPNVYYYIMSGARLNNVNSPSKSCVKQRHWREFQNIVGRNNDNGLN